MRKWVFLFSLLACCTPPPKPVPPPVPVTAFRVEAQTIPADFEYIGVAESSHIVELRARVEGYLEKILYKEGGLVQLGDPMFVLDQRPFVAEVERNRGVLMRDQAMLVKAQQTKNRMVPLYHQNAVSQRDYDNAIDDELAAEADVYSAKADLDKATINLGFASIAAPVTGMASQAKYREGALISPEENLLTTIYVVDPIWVNFNVSESDLLQARQEVGKGLMKWPDRMDFKIEAVLSDGTVIPADGFIDFTNPALQQSTGTMLIRSVIPNPKGQMYPGQFVRVIVKGAIRPDAIYVPQTAVVQGQKGSFVYVVDAGKAREQMVEPGDWYGKYWIINQGLKPGDLVICQGVNKVHNGSPVTVQGISQ